MYRFGALQGMTRVPSLVKISEVIIDEYQHMHFFTFNAF